MKEELGLDHFECRSWIALSHHVILTMIAFAFLQTWRIEELQAQSVAEPTPTSIEETNPSTIELQPLQIDELRANDVAESVSTIQATSSSAIELPKSAVPAKQPNRPRRRSSASRPDNLQEHASKKAQ